MDYMSSMFNHYILTCASATDEELFKRQKCEIKAAESDIFSVK